MSARTFWAIFTLSVIILIQMMIVKPLLTYVVAQDIPSLNIPVSVMNPASTDDAGPPTDEEPTLTDRDIEGKPFWVLWTVLYKVAPKRALSLTASLFLVGLLGGLVIASVAFRHMVSAGDKLSKLSTTDKIAVLVGGFLGISLSTILSPLLVGLGLLGGKPNPTIVGIVGVVVTYLCILAMMNMKEELKYYFPSLSHTEVDKAFQKPKILDTNVIIDGRISDVCSTGFVEGQIYVPHYVLDELQHIADSADPIRRARGRRGLDILNQMRKELDLKVRQCDPVDPENPEEVDARLVKLAKEIDGFIITNDFNLNKVAELQGVPVLNVNELANALKPVVLPGEEMTVDVIKEGKEINQGIAYLDDGTMIVVEGAKRHIGERVDVVVASVLQTVAGKMIFANIKTIQEQEDDLIDRNIRNYSGFRGRKKTY